MRQKTAFYQNMKVIIYNSYRADNIVVCFCFVLLLSEWPWNTDVTDRLIGLMTRNVRDIMHTSMRRAAAAIAVWFVFN